MHDRYTRHNRRKYSLKAHIVLVTKYRKKLLTGMLEEDVKQKIAEVCSIRAWGKSIQGHCPNVTGKRRFSGQIDILRTA